MVSTVGRPSGSGFSSDSTKAASWGRVCKRDNIDNYLSTWYWTTR